MPKFLELTEADKKAIDYERMQRDETLRPQQIKALEGQKRFYVGEEDKIESLEKSMPKVSVFGRIFKSQNYRERENISKEIESLTSQKQQELKEVESYNESIEGQIKALKNQGAEDAAKMEEIKNDKTVFLDEKTGLLRQLKLSVKTNEQGFPIIEAPTAKQVKGEAPNMTDHEKEVTEFYKQFQKEFVDKPFDENTFSEKDLSLVHCTRYFPNDGEIKSTIESGAVKEKLYSVNGETKSGFSRDQRPTVHFTCNGTVSDHMNGGWSDTGIVILDPLSKHMGDIENFKVEDSFSKHSVKLSDEATILVHESLLGKLTPQQQEMYKDRIIGFSGDKEFATQYVLALQGYQPQQIGSHNWFIEKNNIATSYFKEKNPEIDQEAHAETLVGKLESNISHRDGKLSALRNSEVIDSVKEPVIISKEELAALSRGHSENRNSNDETFLKDYGIVFDKDGIKMLSLKQTLDNYEKIVSQEEIDLFQKTLSNVDYSTVPIIKFDSVFQESLPTTDQFIIKLENGASQPLQNAEAEPPAIKPEDAEKVDDIEEVEKGLENIISNE